VRTAKFIQTNPSSNFANRTKTNR